jgi:hypothetical protein
MAVRFTAIAVASLPLLAGITGAAVAAAATGHGYPDAKCLRLVPPAYGAPVWPGTRGKGRVPADIIANWGSTTVNSKTGGGPGTARDAADANTIARARKAGSTVLGYIWTGSGAVPAAAVETQVRQWKSWYGVTDIFLDGAPDGAQVPKSYQKVYAYIHGRAKDAQVWANPGAIPARALMAVADVVNIFEGSYQGGADSLRGVKIPAWVRQYPASRFSFISYSTTKAEMPAALDLIRAAHGGHAYVTDGNPASGNPYGALPGYWRDEVTTAATGCG